MPRRRPRRQRSAEQKAAKACTRPSTLHLPRHEEQADWGTWEYLPVEEMQEFFREVFQREDMFMHAHAVWLNKVYCVIAAYIDADPWGRMIHLYIFRIDHAPVRSWLDLQQIKNEIVDPQATAVEVFPPEDEKVDELNWYHLWVLPPGRRMPFWMGNARPLDMSYWIPGVFVDSKDPEHQHKIRTNNQLPEGSDNEPQEEDLGRRGPAEDPEDPERP